MNFSRDRLKVENQPSSYDKTNKVSIGNVKYIGIGGLGSGKDSSGLVLHRSSTELSEPTNSLIWRVPKASTEALKK